MIVVDACVLIAHFDLHDAHHEAATRLLLDHADEDALIHPLTLAEILVGPARNRNESERARQVSLMGIETWRPGPDDPVRMAQLRARTGLRLPDCAVLSAAIGGVSAVATFDRALTEAARSLHLTVLP